MTPFTTLTAMAAPLPEADIDTDVIFPARFLLLPEKAGLGGRLFSDRRFDDSGAPRRDFVLNRPPFSGARILITGANFGTGSSREHAVWALADFGFRCIIAPSFGEIFYLNCLKNGLLPITLAPAAHAAALDHARSGGSPITVDLETRRIRFDTRSVPFSIDTAHRRALLQGLDEIGQILTDDLAAIRAFEARRHAEAPWLVLPGADPAPGPSSSGSGRRGADRAE